MGKEWEFIFWGLDNHFLEVVGIDFKESVDIDFAVGVDKHF